MTSSIASNNYVKRYKMEVALDEVPSPPPLPDGYSFVPWQPCLLEVHADVLNQCFRQEIDASVFPSFADRAGCACLMVEMTDKAGFHPGATWLLIGPDGYVGTVQGLRERRGLGAIQNLGIVPAARGRGLGTALLLQALAGFRRSGLQRGILEVTARNDAAVRLYRRLGFRCRKTLYKAITAVQAAVMS